MNFDKEYKRGFLAGLKKGRDIIRESIPVVASSEWNRQSPFARKWRNHERVTALTATPPAKEEAAEVEDIQSEIDKLIDQAVASGNEHEVEPRLSELKQREKEAMMKYRRKVDPHPYAAAEELQGKVLPYYEDTAAKLMHALFNHDWFYNKSPENKEHVLFQAGISPIELDKDPALQELWDTVTGVYGRYYLQNIES